MTHLSENSYISYITSGRTCRTCHGVDDEGIVTKGRYLSITPVRGLEKMVAGKPPESAIVLCQRICGVCPIPHTLASAEAMDDSLDIQIPKLQHN